MVKTRVIFICLFLKSGWETQKGIGWKFCLLHPSERWYFLSWLEPCYKENIHWDKAKYFLFSPRARIFISCFTVCSSGKIRPIKLIDFNNTLITAIFVLLLYFGFSPPASGICSPVWSDNQEDTWWLSTQSRNPLVLGGRRDEFCNNPKPLCCSFCATFLYQVLVLNSVFLAFSSRCAIIDWKWSDIAGRILRFLTFSFFFPQSSLGGWSELHLGGIHSIKKKKPRQHLKQDQTDSPTSLGLPGHFISRGLYFSAETVGGHVTWRRHEKKLEQRAAYIKTYVGVWPAAEHANNTTLSSVRLKLSAKRTTGEKTTSLSFSVASSPLPSSSSLRTHHQPDSISPALTCWLTVLAQRIIKRRRALTSRRKGSLSETLPVATHWNEAFCPALTSTSPSREKWGTLSEGSKHRDKQKTRTQAS